MTKGQRKRERTYWPWLVMLAIPGGAAQLWTLTQPQTHTFSTHTTTLDRDAFAAMALVALFGGTIFGLVLPGLKAGALFGDLPKDTYLIPRFALKLLCSIGYGFAIGSILVLPVIPPYAWPLAISFTPQALSLGYASRKRMAKSRKTEWGAPNPWYKVFRPIIRGSRPDA